jgi:hypothetical protein
MQRTIRCPCGRVLIWNETNPGSTACCPACGQVISSTVSREFPAVALPEPSPFDFRDQDVAPKRRQPGGNLYSPFAAGLAGALGGLMAGLVVIGLNFYARRHKAAAVLVMFTGLFATAVAFTVLPDYIEVPNGFGAVLPLAGAIAVQMVAGGILSFAAAWALAAFQRRPGTKHAPLAGALRLAAACAVVVFGLQIVWNYPIAWFGVPPTRTVYYGRGQRLVYSVGIPKETVHGVGNLLVKEGVFHDIDAHSVDVFLLNRDGHVDLKFFLNQPPGIQPPPDVVPFFENLRRTLAAGPLRDTDVWVVLCNSFGKQLVVLR